MIIFIIKHDQEGEFIILWTSGVKKINFVNLFFSISILITIIYLIFSTILTPLALYKSRALLSNDKLNSLLPTVKQQTFGDSFKGFTFIVEEKLGNEVKNIFLNDKGNNLENLSTNTENSSEITVIAQSGIIDKKKIFLINGQIISTKENNKNDIVKFQELSIDLANLSTSTIKKPKIQETSTLKLLTCFKKNNNQILEFCNDNFKKEIYPVLNRRIILPLYIPIISLLCSLLLVKSNKKYFNKASIFIYCFTILLFTELAVRYTGINIFTRISFILLPIVLIVMFYSLLVFLFSKEFKIK